MDKEFSVVIPLYNEEESLEELFRKIRQALDSLKKKYEVVFVDDGSTDMSLERLKEIERENKEVRIYSFRKNLGKSHALMLGFQKSNGKYIVTLDADLQDDPKNIKSLYQKLVKEDLDIVSGWRKDRKDSELKKISSKIFNEIIIPIFFGLKLHDLNCGLKIYKNSVAKELKIYGGMHRFIPLLAYEMGYRVSEVKVAHHPRKYGVSKYKFTKIFTDIPDLLTVFFLTRYNRRPLHFFGKVGGIIFFAGFIILSYLSLLKLSGQGIGNRPLLLFGVLLFITGLQTLFTGLLADLIVNIGSKEHDDFPLKYESQRQVLQN